jgi:hypothetical protein
MIKTVQYALCALAFIGASSGPLLAETTAIPGAQIHSGNFSPFFRLAKDCKADGKTCKTNDQCCSGNCQKATDAPKGTCQHGD